MTRASSAQKPQTVAQTLARGVMRLAKTSDSPRTDAQILLAHCLGRDRAWLLAHGESFLTRPQAERFEELCEKRASGVPIAYITGIAVFYGRDFIVNDSVLVPRPETELMVEEAITHLRDRLDPERRRQVVTVLDVGVGCGTIACTIAAEVLGAAVEGTDVSPAAIKLAEHNARRLNVHARCRFTCTDLVGPTDQRTYDVIVANLPYVPSAQIPGPPDPVAFEPRLTLDGGPDGLNQYRRLLPLLPPLVRPGGLVLLEAAPPVMDGLLALTRAVFPDERIDVRQDYAGRDRFVRVVTRGR